MNTSTQLSSASVPEIPLGSFPARASGHLLAADPKMLQIRELAQRVARTPATVLVTGESGVGKEILARFIHTESGRSGPFVKINCAAVPRELLESELFGHEKGAFTGAHQRKEGKFELAGSGTILLDEIGEMDLGLQAKLLHVLEDSTITRVGGNEPVPLRARVLATTNRPLEQCIAAGEFRQDLYYRLKVIQIEVPPLRRRREDIPLLANHYLEQFGDRQNRAITSFSPRVEAALVDYPWPGNVRELKHLVLRYVILPDDDMILSELAANEAMYRNGKKGFGGSLLGGAAIGGFGGWSGEETGRDSRRPAGLAADDGGAREGSGRRQDASVPGNGGNGNGNGNGHDSHDSHDSHESHGDRPFFGTGFREHDFLGEHFYVDRKGLHLEADYAGEIPLKEIAATAAEQVEKQVILAVLEETRWNRKEAAARLDICYKTLLNKLERWHLGARSDVESEMAQA